MGGKGSGGSRLGAGRPRKRALEKQLGGTAPRPPQTPAAAGEAIVTPAPDALEPILAPADLGEEERAVWATLGPVAIREKTLTADTVFAFRQLVALIVLRRKLLARIEADGWVQEDENGKLSKHPLAVEQRGTLMRIETWMLRFRVTPIGKDLAADDDPFGAITDGDRPSPTPAATDDVFGELERPITNPTH